MAVFESLSLRISNFHKVSNVIEIENHPHKKVMLQMGFSAKIILCSENRVYSVIDGLL